MCQIAGRLDVSVDWLLGRTDVMDLPKGEDEAASLRPILSGVGIAPWYMKGVTKLNLHGWPCPAALLWP
ncbi:MAG: hypothetical protein WA579_13155, partial [Rhodomicrobium sp.]